ncbi:apolipoprotein N-acyltransferase [Deinococcus alpinitundrae]|uniref:apolipoprotein N-acyltransferase n=1 Tax=Deinococcus alpinitundrae TaxID=468913 RepID=UPI00137AE918|nr:apolipoprotein N-acyltransferase [Deinococcus alpinitundrae]
MRLPLHARLQGLLSAALGVLTALCGLPLWWSALSVLPLSVLLWQLSRQPSARQVVLQTFWAISAYFAAQLFWLVVFMHNLMASDGGLPSALAWVLAALALSLLFMLEGVFWAILATLVARIFRTPQARLWGLAGGWVILEWTRTLGALAFPWSGLGYTLLRTPLIQVADLGGVLLLSALITASAAALVTLAQLKNPRPAFLMAVLWLFGLGYGLTRVPGQGPVGQALLLRTDFDSFSKAAGLSFDQFWQTQLKLSSQRRPGEVLIWSETAVPDPASLLGTSDFPGVPAPGLYGLAQRPRNTAVGWDSQTITGSFDKAHPVPMGEYFPLSGVLRPLYDLIFNLIGFAFDPQFPGQSYTPIPLGGVLYGVYICYDSIVASVARWQALGGAQVLVNVSNDGWYSGWGVWQHFDMGRVRAIETRRYVLRSVNKGVAAVVDDLGQPVQILTAGEGVLHAEFPLLSTTTLYMRLGDVPALMAALLLIGYAARADRRR